MTEQEIQTRYSVHFCELDAQIVRLEAVLREHSFLSGKMQHVVVHALVLRLIELARSCGILSKAGMAAASASLNRQCLEVGFKLKAICSGNATAEDFMTQEIISRAKSRRWVLQNAAALEALGPELSKSLAKEADEAVRLEETKGLKEIKPYEWAARAEEIEVYLFAYSTLSDFIHCGPASLGHIFDVKQDGQVFMQTGPSDYLIEHVIEGACHCLASSSNAIQSMFAKNADAQIPPCTAP